MKKKIQYIDIEIDKITNSIENAISGDSFDTDVNPVSKDDIKQIKKLSGWQFNWNYEFKQSDRVVYKLTIKNKTNRTL